MTVANGIFSDKAFSLNPEYTKNTQKYLNSEVRSVDFSGNPTFGESEINKWVNNKTNGKISEIFNPGINLIIIALYCFVDEPFSKQMLMGRIVII